MSINSLPDELLARILYFLGDEPVSYINFASTCRRIDSIYKSQVSSKLWLKLRPVSFNIRSNVDTFQTSTKSEDFECECRTWDNPPDEPCYYSRYSCLMSSKQRVYSSLRFKDSFLVDRGCTDAINRCKTSNEVLAKTQLMALVEISLINCFISIQGLDLLMRLLPNVVHLDVDNYKPWFRLSERQNSIESDTKGRLLNHLGIKRFTHAPLYHYLLNNYKAKELDISGIFIAASSVRRNFNPIMRPAVMRPDVVRPQESLSPLAVIDYLVKMKSIIRHLIVKDIKNLDLLVERIRQDPDLKHLRISH